MKITKIELIKELQDSKAFGTWQLQLIARTITRLEREYWDKRI